MKIYRFFFQSISISSLNSSRSQSKNSTKVTSRSLSQGQDGRNSAQAEDHHEGHDGFSLANSVRVECRSVKERSIGKFYQIQGSVTKRLLYCPMEKVGTTFWRRVLYMLTAPDGKQYKNPYDVPIDKALKSSRLYSVPLHTVAQSFLESNSFSFLVVRNPFSRLLSAFVDKLVPPNPYYWKVFGSKAILAFRNNASAHSKMYGHDVTFQEFVKFVTRSEMTKKDLDPHYVSTFSSCKPCERHYKYIGKMETFKDDALFILKKAGMNSSAEYLSDGNIFSNLTTDDAITDSIYSPFSWKKNVLQIITWDKALRRVWLKLQMRGIISFSEKFDSYIEASETENMTADQFINKARGAHAVSKPADLKRQKLDVMKEAFQTLHIDELIEFRNAFKYDFELYGYDKNPVLLFERPVESQRPTKYFNYGYLN